MQYSNRVAILIIEVSMSTMYVAMCTLIHTYIQCIVVNFGEISESI